MYAVIKTGGKEYTVKVGDELLVELLNVEGNVIFNEVLLISDGESVKLGAPYIEGAAVEADILGEERGKKILVFKRKRRKDYRKRIGHKQHYNRIKITKITPFAN
ncbi:MAG: 50S ribosomal protein L21 [Deferribacteraceae bacterium]|jgi:large subunit ribosomal protein L21|nr:50S ribosomal protein L21 [Deferribacteraceae bacterium]